jgi:hypothetical protein
LSETPRDLDGVVPLHPQTRSEAPTPRRATARIGRLHGLAIVGMAAFAVIGSLATLAFITVGWPGRLGHYVVAVIVVSTIGFMASASVAVLSAARHTYVRRADRDHESPE